MASKELRNRNKWQSGSLIKTLSIEDMFHQVFKTALNIDFPEQFIVDRHPEEFGDIYSTYNFPDDVLQKIYKDYLGEPGGHKAHELLHTSYVARKKYKLDD